LAGFGDNSGGFEGEGAYKEMIAKVRDIKAAPHHGQKRLIVSERGKIHTQAVIDIDISAVRDLEENETYVFKVKEKDDSRYGYQRKKATSFTAYSCDDVPEEFTPETIARSLMSRFGGENGGKDHKRTRF
jgi:hypothetical protein